MIQNGSARRSLNAFCVPSNTISITTINEKYSDAYRTAAERIETFVDDGDVSEVNGGDG